MRCPLRKRLVYEYDGRDHINSIVEHFMDCIQHECNWFTAKNMCSARHFAEFEPVTVELDKIIDEDDGWKIKGEL